MGEDFIALKRQSATTTAIHGQNVLSYKRTPKSFVIEKCEQKHDFYIGTDKQNVFLSIFLHIFVYQGHML